MENGLTVGFLRARIWIATLVILVSLAASSAVLAFALRAQEAKSQFTLAFNRIAETVTRVEHELAVITAGGKVSPVARQRARTAYVELLGLFVAVRAAADDPVTSDAGHRQVMAVYDDRVSEVAMRAGLDPEASQRAMHLGGHAMPPALAAIWKGPGNGQSRTAQSDGDIPLDVWLGRFLLHAEPLVYEGFDHLADARNWAPLTEQLEAIADEHILPALDRLSVALSDEFHQVLNRATVSILALAGIGLLAALFNVAFIFRPLMRTVLANQAALIEGRDKAVAADIAKRNFLSVLSHELRTPMNGILGFASLLRGSDMRPEHRKQIEIIHSSGKALLSLVNDILDFSKLEAGSLELSKEPFSVEEAVCGVVTLLRGGAVAKGLEFSVFVDPRLPAASLGDSNRLRQVLTNLVGNAIKFTDSGGIAIEAHEVSSNADPGAGCELQLVVVDTGIGIPSDKHEQIFERFAQIDSSSRRRFEGTGLGLAICRELVERMGGRIWVESSPGAGSTFYVRLPLAAAEPPAEATNWRQRAERALADRRVLVVDRFALGRRIARLQLEGYGLRVDEAAEPDEAIRLIEQAEAARASYAAVIVDEMAPGTEGLDLARRLHDRGGPGDLPLILNVTPGAHGMERVREEGLGVLQMKPVMPRALIGALCDLVAASDGPEADERGEVGRSRILLVDDRQIAQQVLNGLLVTEGYKVDLAGSASEALRAASGQSYDAILIDIRVPVRNSIDIARRIRALQGGAGNIPILGLAPAAGEDDRPSFPAGLFDLIVEKNVASDGLLVQLEQVLAAGAAPGESNADTASWSEARAGLRAGGAR